MPGDMPINLQVMADGTDHVSFVTHSISLKKDAKNSVFANGGTAFVIHEKADDMMTDPTGNAGGQNRVRGHRRTVVRNAIRIYFRHCGIYRITSPPDLQVGNVDHNAAPGRLAVDTSGYPDSWPKSTSACAASIEDSRMNLSAPTSLAGNPG